MCGPEDPFHASPAACKGPISSKRVSSQDPFWENFEILASTASIFTQILAHKPQIWKFSAHKPPNLEIFRSQAPPFRGKCQFASPTLRKSGPHTPTWKKVECPPPPPGLKLLGIIIGTKSWHCNWRRPGTQNIKRQHWHYCQLATMFVSVMLCHNPLLPGLVFVSVVLCHNPLLPGLDRNW